ncbi:MAG: hypothetical protein ACXU8U_09895 [Asticcacaulis sp.]
MDTVNPRPIYPEAIDALNSLNKAVEEALDRKRKLGQYWVEWDGEKPVKVWPDGRREPA